MHTIIAVTPMMANIAENVNAAVGHAYCIIFKDTEEAPLMLTLLSRGERALTEEHKDGIKLWEGINSDPRWADVLAALRHVDGIRISE